MQKKFKSEQKKIYMLGGLGPPKPPVNRGRTPPTGYFPHSGNSGYRVSQVSDSESGVQRVEGAIVKV